jgi:stringent starvation protein B
MTSKRPYLIRAIFEWLLDNGLTPHLIVDAEHPSAVVPMEFADNGRIVLNIAPQAVQGFHIGNDLIRFSARFGGRPFTVELAPHAVLGLVARENGEGMAFLDEEPAMQDETADADDAPAGHAGREEPGTDGTDPKPDRSHLRVVK